jgi:predicted transcriptional regulator
MKSEATLISEAKAALAVADAAEQQQADSRRLESDARWEAAECMAALDERGKGYREIAEAVGVSAQTVSRYVALVRKGVSARRQLFTDAMRELRGGWGHEPASIDGKAKAVAAAISDQQVWTDPVVKQAVHKAVEKELRARPKPPTPPWAQKPPPGLLAARTYERASYWTKFGWQLDSCLKVLAEARTEMRRSGLPEGRPGELIRKLRRLAADAAKTEQLLAETAIGEPSATG